MQRRTSSYILENFLKTAAAKMQNVDHSAKVVTLKTWQFFCDSDLARINLNPIDLKKCLFCKGTKCTFSFFHFLLAFCFPVTWHDQISFHMHIWLCYYRVRMPWRISTLIGTYGGEAQRKAFRRIFGAKNDFPLLLHSPQLELLSPLDGACVSDVCKAARENPKSFSSSWT